MTAEAMLFLRRFLANPSRVFSLFPSSAALSREIANQIVRAENEYVVELGAGTGSVTRAILESGVPASKLIVVEIDNEMAQFLRKTYPGITVLECSAFEFDRSLPDAVIGNVGCVVCGIPIGKYSIEQQWRLAQIMLSLMPPGRSFLVLSFRLASPIHVKKIRLTYKKLGVSLRNFPPASVWAYGSDSDAPPPIRSSREQAQNVPGNQNSWPFRFHLSPSILKKGTGRRGLT